MPVTKACKMVLEQVEGNNELRFGTFTLRCLRASQEGYPRPYEHLCVVLRKNNWLKRVWGVIPIRTGTDD